jgi:16S rRNA processing protein RimM
MAKKITIAKIIGTHGLKGNVKIKLFISRDVFEKILESKSDFFIKDNICTLSIVNTLNNNVYVVKIDSIDIIEEAIKLQNYEIFIDRSALGDELLISDVISFSVVIVGSDKIYGYVKDYCDYGSGPLLEIDLNCDKSKKNNTTLLYHFTYDNFPEVDMAKSIIYLKEAYNILEEG